MYKYCITGVSVSYCLRWLLVRVLLVVVVVQLGGLLVLARLSLAILTLLLLFVGTVRARVVGGDARLAFDRVRDEVDVLKVGVCKHACMHAHSCDAFRS